MKNFCIHIYKLYDNEYDDYDDKNDDEKRRLKRTNLMMMTHTYSLKKIK